MIDNLPDDVIKNIICKLYNYDIFNLTVSCKKMNSLIIERTFIDYILRREHPLVFDSWGIYCSKCNLRTYNSINKENIWCRH